MKTTAKIFLISLIIISLFSLFLADKIVFAANAAQNAANQLCQNANDCPITDINDIYRILNTIASYVYTIFFLVAIIVILLAAFTFLTAGGDPTKINSARNQILWAAVAVAIALLSYSASTIIKSVLNTPTN